MNAKTPPPTPNPLMRRDDWVGAFAARARALWPELGARLATSVGLARSTGALATDPAEAARRWVSTASARRPEPGGRGAGSHGASA